MCGVKIKINGRWQNWPADGEQPRTITGQVFNDARVRLSPAKQTKGRRMSLSAKPAVLMSREAFGVMEQLTKNTLIDLVWSIVQEHAMPENLRDDEHLVLKVIDGLAIPIDQRRQQRPKLLASKYAELRVRRAQGGAVVTKQVRVRFSPRRRKV